MSGAEPPEAETKPAAVRSRHVVLWSVVVLLAVLSSTTFHLRSDEGARALAIELAAFLDRALAGGVDIGRIEAVDVDEVVLHAVRVSSASGEVLATIERVRLRVDAGSLGTDAVVVHDLEATTAWLTLRKEGEDLALAVALRPTAEAERETGSSFTVEHLSLAGFELVELPEGFAIRDLAAEGQLSTRPSPELVIESLEAEVRRDDEVLGRLDESRARLVVEGESNAELRFASGESYVRFDGDVTRASARVTRFGASAELDLEEELLERIWTSDAAMVLGTRLRGRVEIERDDGALRGSAALTTDGGELGLDVSENEDGIEARAFSDSLALGEILDGADLDVVGGEIVARIGNADVEGGSRALEIEARNVFYGEHVVPEAVVTATVGEEFVDVEGVSVPAWTGEEGELVLTGRIAFDRSLDLALRADLPGLAADDNVQRRAPGIRGSVEADLALHLTAGDTPTLDVDGRLAVRDAAFGGLRVAALAVEGTARGEARRPIVDLAISGQRITSESLSLRAIRAGLEGGPETYALRGRAQLANRRTVGVSLDAVRGEDGLHVGGDATLSGFLAEEVSLAISELHFAEDASIVLEELTARGAGIDARASGTYRAEGGSELEVDLRSLDLGAATGSGLTRGTGHATLRASGTLLRPEVELEATLEHAALGPLSAPEVRLTAGLSAADRSVRVALGGDFEGYGRLALDANGRLGTGPTLERRLQRTDWNATLDLHGVPLTLAMLLSPDLPPWDGVVDASVRLGGVLPTPNAHVEAEVRGFAASGSDPVDADVRLDFATPHLDAVIAVSDRRGPLATFSGRARIEPAALRAPLDRRRIADSASWSLSFSMPRRRIDRLPRPLRRDVALSAAIEGEVTRNMGDAPRGEGRIVLTRYDASDHEGCRHGGLSTIGLDVDVGPTSTVRFAANTTGRASLRGEARAETPLARWLADGLPESPPEIALEAHAEGLDLRAIPVLCERAAGSVDLEVSATRLLTERPRARLTVRSSDLRIGDADPVVASLTASARDGRMSALVGVTREPHRARIRLGAPLRFDGSVPRRPRRIEVEQLVYRNGGGSAELAGTAHLGETLGGGVVLDGTIRRLPLVREGRPAGRLSARAHVEASYGSERRELLARFTETRFDLPPAPRLSRAERRRQSEERRQGRLEGRRERRTRAEGDDVRTHIVLDATEPFWVRRDDLRLELSTRLLVDVVEGEPRLRGRVNVHGGRMDAEVGHYDIDDGYIAFWGGGRAPEMVLRGTFEGRRGRRRRVTLLGPLGETEVRFE